MLEAVSAFETRIKAAVDPDDALTLLSAIGSEMGFDGVAYVFAPRTHDQDGSKCLPPVRLFCPQFEEWDSIYARKGYFRYDWIYQACLSTTLPVCWSFHDVNRCIFGQPRRLTAIQHELAREAYGQGLCSGITVPIHLPASQLAFTCFLSREDAKEFQARVVSLQNVAMLLAHHFHQTVTRLFQFRTAAISARLRLTARECQCLELVASGKTNEVIGDILGVSERTVRFHLQNAAYKVGGLNRSHTVIKAASFGLIRPNA